ncbi:3243_t:CDS:1, partial [Entrophospora sp. SA101]
LWSLLLSKLKWLVQTPYSYNLKSELSSTDTSTSHVPKSCANGTNFSIEQHLEIPPLEL